MAYIIIGGLILLIIIVWLSKDYALKPVTPSFQCQNRQERVKQERATYGVSNCGTSMDQADIYVLDYNKYGIHERENNT